MTTRSWRIALLFLVAAASIGLGVPARAADPATAPDKVSPDEQKWADLFKGNLTIYLEGSLTVPFASDVTFERRVRISDKEYVVFKDKTGTLTIRTQQIIAIRSTPAK